MRSKVVFETHIHVDWPIYLVIFLEIAQLYGIPKENLAIEAIDCILMRFLKLNPEVIAYSIRRFEELFQERVFQFRKLVDPKNELIDLFSIQYTQSQKSGNKFHHIKSISKRQDLENKLLWYNILMLCNQSFRIPGHSKWREHLVNHVDVDQLSIYDASNLNTIWEFGIQFGIKLGLSFHQRFLLSHIVSCVSSNVRNYTFQNFNIILDFILKSQYNAMEIADFINYYSNFISQFSKSDKHYLTHLIESNPKACVEKMCLTLTKLATLVCTATRESEENVSQCEICKRYWFDIFGVMLSNVMKYYLAHQHIPKDFAVVLRCFYDTIKIPTAPEVLVKPWIKEQKKEIVALMAEHFCTINIVTFYEILKKFPVAILPKMAIFDYFTKYQPANNTSLKDQIWYDFLVIIFKIKDPPKSIFQTFEKIFNEYLKRNAGFEFICICLKFDLPAYGLEYKSTDEEEKIVSNFMRSVEIKCKHELRLMLHSNLVYILNCIPKLRLPSLLQAIIMSSICRGIVPENSLLSNPTKDGPCKELILSLQSLSYQRNVATVEQLTNSYELYYLWKILASISRGIKLEKLDFLGFPYMVTVLMFVFGKFCMTIPGFQDYAWEDDNLLSFIEFCKKTCNFISGHYSDILNDECSLIDYIAILTNLQNLNELFKNSGLAILSKKVIQTKIDTFNVVSHEMKKTLILELEVEETEIKSAFLLNFLNDHQTVVPDGIRIEIDALFNLCDPQVLRKNRKEKHALIPVLEARDTIKIKEFRMRCANIVDSFKMFSYPIYKESVYSVHQFLAHFSTRENVLFDACLRKCMADRMGEIREREGQDIHYISMDQFVECTIECYELLDRICVGISTYSEIEQVNKNLSLAYLDFSQIHSDIKMFPPLAARMQSKDLKTFNDIHIRLINSINIIGDVSTRIKELCAEYDPQTFIETIPMLPSPPDVDKPITPNNLYGTLQFLILLCEVQLPPILLTIAGYTIINNVLNVYSEISQFLNVKKADFFLSNIAISYEIIKFQQKFNEFIHNTPFNKCTNHNLSLFVASCTLMSESARLIVQQFNSRQMLKSQLYPLKEKLTEFNNILELYGELEPIDINALSSQICEFEEKQREIQHLLFFNPDVCTAGSSLLHFMKNYSVNYPPILDEYVTFVLSRSDANEVTLVELRTKCSFLRKELSLLSGDVFNFMSFFSTNNNLLFLSLLGQITSHRVKQLAQQLDIKQFVQCVHETYRHMHSMCIGDFSYSQLQSLFVHSSTRSADLKNIVDNLSEFPKFSLILRDGFPSLCLFELQAFSHYIPSVVQLCENYNLGVCMNSFDYQSLQRHSYNLLDIKYCDKINIPLATQLMRDISQLTSSMSLNRMKLMATIAICNEIVLVFKELNLKKGRTDLEHLLSRILSDPELAEHHLLISANLLPVYDCLTPLFDNDLHFSDLMHLYSTLPLDNEEATALKLEQFKSNINVIKLCFVRVNAL